jgi:uncharacterized protein (DUF362 family)
MSVTRRSFFARAGAIAAAQGLALNAQQGQQTQPTPPAKRADPRQGTADAAKYFKYFEGRSKVSLIKGENRRQNIYDSLVAIDDQILPRLKTKKYVFVKPNGNEDAARPLGATRADAVRGIFDYLGPRFKGPIVFGDTGLEPSKVGFEKFGWDKVFAEYKSLDLKFETPNEHQDQYGLIYGIDYDQHLIPIRLGARFVDPDAFAISASVLKTHNFVVATMAVKNMVVGAALHTPPGNAPFALSEKRKYHVGVRGGNYNMFMATQRMLPTNWGIGIVDGFEGMEGNGPGQGTPVGHRIALASTDFLAVDRVSLECMGIDASWPGYLNYAYQAGLGQYDLSKIDVLGAKIADVQKKYRLHADTDIMLEWRGPMLDLPPNLGRNRPHPLHEDLSQYAPHAV